MAPNWPLVRVEEFADKVAMGPFGSNIKVETFVDSGVPVISGAHLRGARVEDGSFNFVTPEHAERLKNSNVLRGDVVFTHAGNIGQVAYVPESSRYERYVISQRQFYLRCDRSKADPAFITYFFHSPEGQHKLLVNASQVGVPSISRPSSNLKEIEVALPPLAEQRAIAGFLGSIDDRIDNLRQTNATLEAIAQALFKSWFVDFDPVRAKAEGREPEGMDAATAALFPSEFEDSELGPIPKGWRVETFGSAFEFTMGQSPPGTTYNTDGEGAAFFQGCTDFGDVFPVRRVFTTAPSRFAKAGDVLMSVRAPVGAVNLAVTDCAIGRGLCAIRHKSGSTGLTIEFVKASVQRIEAAAGEGALFKSLSKRQLADLPVVSAGEALVTAAIELLDPIVERRLLLARQAESLTQLRDTLLPRLISGRLRLSTIHSDSTSVGHNPTANNEDSDIKA